MSEQLVSTAAFCEELVGGMRELPSYLLVERVIEDVLELKGLLEKCIEDQIHKDVIGGILSQFRSLFSNPLHFSTDLFLEYGLKTQFLKNLISLLLIGTEGTLATQARWGQLGTVVCRKTLPEEHKEQLGRLLHKRNIAVICASENSSTSTTLKNIRTGYNIIRCSLSKQRTKSEAERVLREKRQLLRTAWSLSLQPKAPIGFNEKIYIPRLFQQLNKPQQSANSPSSHYIQVICQEPAIAGCKFSMATDRARKRVPVRVLSATALQSITSELPRLSFCCGHSEYSNLPENESLIIHFYGGKFVSFSTQQDHVRHWAKSLGVTVLSLEYRLPPEFSFDEALDDAWQLYCWVLQYALKFLYINPSKVVLAGESFGATLALRLCSKLQGRGQSLPSGLLLSYPVVLELNEYVPSIVCSLEDLIVPYWMVDSENHSEITESKFTGYPRTRIVVGDKDPFLDESLRLAEAMNKEGVDVKVQVYEGGVHEMLALSTGVNAFSSLVEDSTQLLRELLD